MYWANATVRLLSTSNHVSLTTQIYSPALVLLEEGLQHLRQRHIRHPERVDAARRPSGQLTLAPLRARAPDNERRRRSASTADIRVVRVPIPRRDIL